MGNPMLMTSLAAQTEGEITRPAQNSTAINNRPFRIDSSFGKM
jgi:hypothetical protein